MRFPWLPRSATTKAVPATSESLSSRASEGAPGLRARMRMEARRPRSAIVAVPALVAVSCRSDGREPKAAPLPRADQVHVATARRLVAADAGGRRREVVAIPPATLTNPWLVSPRVQGFQPAPLAGAHQWAAVWLSP